MLTKSTIETRLATLKSHFLSQLYLHCKNNNYNPFLETTSKTEGAIK